MQNLRRVALLLLCLLGVSAQAETSSQDIKPAQTSHDCKGCPEMVVIPAGRFFMGIGGVAIVRSVTIAYSFSLGQTEVTQGQWRSIMGNNPSRNSQCGDTCPVENVSWMEVQDFIQKLNALTGKLYRLPSEAEWEYACRAGKQGDFCGDAANADNVAWYSSNSRGSIHPVATKQANAWDLYDMSGNLYEWVNDSWHRHDKGAPVDGSSWSDDSSYHVVRGGAFNDASRNVTSYRRSYYDTKYKGNNIGFRLAKSDSTSISSEKILAIETLAPQKQSTQTSDSITQKLRDLQSLKKDGIITEEEFQKTKKQLLEKY